MVFAAINMLTAEAAAWWLQLWWYNNQPESPAQPGICFYYHPRSQGWCGSLGPLKQPDTARIVLRNDSLLNIIKEWNSPTKKNEQISDKTLTISAPAIRHKDLTYVSLLWRSARTCHILITSETKNEYLSLSLSLLSSPDVISIRVTLLVREEAVGVRRGGGDRLAGHHAGQGGLHPGAGRQVFQALLGAGHGGAKVARHGHQRALLLVIGSQAHQVSIGLL